MELINNEVSFVIKGIKGAKVDKTLRFNKEVFTIAYFCFTSDFFSLFCPYYFFSISSID